MPLTPRLAGDIVAALRNGKTLRVRAGTTHRFIGIWVVVVQSRVFVRSWSVKPRGWYRALLEDPRAFIKLGHRTIAVRAVRTRSHALRDAVDQAYLDKYATPGALKYARDLGSPKSRATTLELRPPARTQADGRTRSVSRPSPARK